MPLPQIASVVRDDINLAKKWLASEVTALVHGEATALECEAAAENKTGITDGMPGFVIPRADIRMGIRLCDVFVQAGLVKGSGELERLAKQGGVRVNDNLVDGDIRRVVEMSDFTDQGMKLSIGKKRVAVVKFL